MAVGTELFWVALGSIAQAIEATVVLATAFVIIFEIQRMRRESIENRVTGLKLAFETLNSEDIVKVIEATRLGESVRGVNWQSLLEQINLVALLVDQGYTELSLLLKLKGSQLATLDQCFQSSAPPYLKSEPTYSPAYSLLKRSRQFVDKRMSTPSVE